MKKIMIVLCSGLVFYQYALADTQQSYAQLLCMQSDKYTCVTVKSKESWKTLWPNTEQQDILMRLNRTNMPLRPGAKIAVPKNLENLSIWDVSPFPRHIKPMGRKLIVVNQNKLAWGAYDTDGELQWWGPISSGKNYCKDVKRNCYTVTGSFHVFNKDNEKCVSNVFPVETSGGANMPFCMFFYRGYALHGSDEVPGYRDSHGCVRLFTQDAEWLNNVFVDLPEEKNKNRGTVVTIEELIPE